MMPGDVDGAGGDGDAPLSPAGSDSSTLHETYRISTGFSMHSHGSYSSSDSDDEYDTGRGTELGMEWKWQRDDALLPTYRMLESPKNSSHNAMFLERDTGWCRGVWWCVPVEHSVVFE